MPLTSSRTMPVTRTAWGACVAGGCCAATACAVVASQRAVNRAALTFTRTLIDSPLLLSGDSLDNGLYRPGVIGWRRVRYRYVNSLVVRQAEDGPRLDNLLNAA